MSWLSEKLNGMLFSISVNFEANGSELIELVKRKISSLGGGRINKRHTKKKNSRKIDIKGDK